MNLEQARKIVEEHRSAVWRMERPEDAEEAEARAWTDPVYVAALEIVQIAEAEGR